MITENVKNLFSFIDYLHSNKAYLLSKKDLIDETNKLLQKRSSIRPNDNYKAKIEYDKIQIEIAEKFDIVEAEIINPLKDKISELDIADISTPIINLNAQSDLFDLQRNFEEDDLKLIFEAKQKYLDFRNETDFDYYLQFFFFELDRTLKEFYDFFKDDDFNDFSKLQTNVVSIESLDEEGIQKAVRKLTGNSNKLHFETFPEFLDYLKREVKDLDFDDRHSEAKRILEQKKIKLENSTFQSEIDEIKEFSESAVKDFKDKLLLSFTNENYKTKVNGGINPYIIAIAKLYFEYENLYNTAKNKCDNFSISYSADNSIEFRNQKTFFPFPVYNLFELVTNLRETLLKEDVCALDLQEYPDIIFNDAELKQHPNLAGYIYNIIYTWINDIEISLHSGNKKRLFDDFLALCKEKATNSNKITVSEPQPITGSRTKRVILEKFENFDNKGWNYAFQLETDFNLFVDLLTNYFEANPYQLPTNIIQLKKGCKTKTAKTLGEIQKELSQQNLSNDKEFFKILRVLNHFEKEPEADLYKALTR